MIRRSMQLIVIMSMVLAFSCATVLSMEAPEEAPREYQESAPTMETANKYAPPAYGPPVYQEKAPVMENLGGYNATADAVVNETNETSAAPVMEKLAGENATAEAKAKETEEETEPAEAEPPEYQKTAPNIPGFGICPTLSMLLTGFIIFSRKYSLR